MTVELSHFPAASTARVPTERPSRYGKQLASHMGHKLTATWNEDARTGRLIFDRDGTASGYLDMRAEAEALILDLYATEEHRERLQDVVARHLERFGTKDELHIVWTSSH